MIVITVLRPTVVSAISVLPVFTVGVVLWRRPRIMAWSIGVWCIPVLFLRLLQAAAFFPFRKIPKRVV
jgi:hypothetical protein